MPEKSSSKRKIELLKNHLIDKEPISKICEENKISPRVFYLWQKKLFENGEYLFDRSEVKSQKRQEEKLKAYENKLKKKDEVIAELMEEHLKLKKNLGEI